MKQKDILTIIVVAIVSGAVSVALSHLIVPATSKNQEVEVVPAIQSALSQPNPKYFNTSSVDPTQLITIGNNANPAPFNGSN